MLSEKDNKKLHHLINIAYIAVFIVIGYLVVRYLLGPIAPFLIAIAVALLVEPAVRFLTNKARFPRGLASAVCVVVVLALILTLGGFLSNTLIGEVKSLLSKVPGYLSSIMTYLRDFVKERQGILGMLPENVLNSAINYIANYDYTGLLTGSIGSVVIGYAGNVVVHIPNAIIFFIVTIVSSIFMSASFPIVKKFVLNQFNEKHRALIIDIKRDFFSTIWNYLRSYSLLIVITFTELLIFFLIFNFKPAFTLAFVIAIVDILPILGVGTVLLPWALFCLLSGSPWRALILLCMYIVITIVRQTLEPKIIGDHVGLMPIVTLFCIWVGLKLFGFLGMFMLPVSVVILKNLQESGKIKIWKEEEDLEEEPDE